MQFPTTLLYKVFLYVLFSLTKSKKVLLRCSSLFAKAAKQIDYFEMSWNIHGDRREPYVFETTRTPWVSNLGWVM